MTICFTIYGEPASKANSRKAALVGKGDQRRMRFIKSAKALEYEDSCLVQIPRNARVMLQGPIKITLRIFYRTERPDLDESLILDCLQNRYRVVIRRGEKVRELDRPGVYVNDRQVREKHVYHAIDRREPRAEIEIEELTPQFEAVGLLLPESLGAAR